MGEQAFNLLHGVTYTYKNGLPAPPYSWAFWLLNKSKKVWFRIPIQCGSSLGPVSFFYKGNRIRYQASVTASRDNEGVPLAPSNIVWGDPLENGWGEGPEGTNYYLSIWTRWSVLHLAQGHPEWFTISFRLSSLQQDGG